MLYIYFALDFLLDPSLLYLGVGTACYPRAELLEVVLCPRVRVSAGEDRGDSCVTHGWPLHRGSQPAAIKGMPHNQHCTCGDSIFPIELTNTLT